MNIYSSKALHGRATGIYLLQSAKVKKALFAPGVCLPKTYTKIKIGGSIALKESWRPLARASIEGKALGMRNQFGVGNVIGSSKTECDTGKIQSMSLLPDNVADVVDCLWPIFARKTGDIREESASESRDVGEVQGSDRHSGSAYELAQDVIQERRIKTVLCAKTEGKSLVECSSSWELCETIAHCLLGWLDIYQRGYLHCNISIRNVRAMYHREKRNPFRVNEECRLQPTQLMDGIQAAIRGIEVWDEIDVTLFMNELTRFTETELAGTSCAGFVCGGDMAKNWKAMFDNWDEDTVAKSDLCGTEYFMSDRIRHAPYYEEFYLQSPVDDLESFFHVFVWAILHNEDSQNALSTQERECRDNLSASVEYRTVAQRDLRIIAPVAPIISQLRGVVKAWDNTQEELQWKYNLIGSKYGQLVANKSIGQDGIPEQAFWKWIWNLIAYEGVQRIVEIIYSHRDKLTAYPSFNEV